MKKLLFLLLALLLSPQIINASNEDSLSRKADIRKVITVKNPKFIAVKSDMGLTFKTNDFVKGKYSTPTYSALHLKFGISSKGESWEDGAYGMPYYGIGLYSARFKDRSGDLGQPNSLYMFQGATIYDFTQRLKLNYEWNLGASFGWEQYDPFTNPDNVAIGSEVNVHVGLNFYLKYMTRSGLDFHLGADVTHFSNGASKMPNKGLNLGAIYFEIAYNFNRPRQFASAAKCPLPPPHKPYFVSDFMVNISSRQIYADTVGTGMSDIVLNHKFKVLGVTYSFMRVPNYRYRYGLSADFVYDESSGSTARRELNPLNNKYYDRVTLGSTHDRFSLGISAKGEVTLPGYSVFANFGCNVIHGNKKDNRLYQIIGAKVYLKENLFGTFGIRASNFSSAQFLYWSLGYTIEHNRKVKLFSSK